MYIKKIKLDYESIERLMQDGVCECEHRKDAKCGEVYELSSFKGKFVMVESCDERKMRLIWTDAVMNGTTRTGGRGIRKVSIKSRLDNGAFIGGVSKFAVGEEVSVCEMYSYLCNVIGKKEGKAAKEAFERKVAEGHGVDVTRIGALSGWNNRKHVKPELMPRKVRIESAEVVNVQDISDDDWHLMGVDWMNKEFETPVKVDYVGSTRWATNAKVVLYRYSTISGSVQNDMDLLTCEQRKALVAERLRGKE